MNYPVYAAQYVTWRKAQELNLTSLGIRRSRQHRDGYSQLARDMVALSVKVDRIAARNNRRGHG